MMNHPFVHKVGGVLSADIAVPEHERELAFYSAVLTTGDSALWRDDLMNNQGSPVIGLGPRAAEYDFLPLQWMPHFQVADISSSVECSNRMGGKELMHSKTDDGQSQWAVLADPDGAAFGLIPVVAEESNTIENVEQIGRISWLSLTVPDAEKSREFYCEVVGWNARSIEKNDEQGPFADFQMLIKQDFAAAEICHGRGERKAVPAVWLIHLPVGDLDESLRRVDAGGGEIIKEFAEAKGVVVRDPVGAIFALQAN